MNKKVLIYILFISLIIGIALAIYGFYTFNQVSQVISSSSDKEFQKELSAFISGNCTGDEFLEKYYSFEKEIKSICSNPVLKPQIEKQTKDFIKEYNVSQDINLCEEINNPSGEYSKYISNLKENCN